MKISYLSDLHLDFISSDITFQKMIKIVKKIIKENDSEVLMIAGDLSHYVFQSIIFIEICIELFDFKRVFVVAGNHEFYNVSKKQSEKYPHLYDKYNELKEKVNNIDNAYFLDSDVIEYKGVKFGGCMSWYDQSYFYKMKPDAVEELNEYLLLWKLKTNDSNLIPELSDPYILFEHEIQKVIKVIEQKPDVMMTHICPISEPTIISDKYKYDISTTFYCFDFFEYFTEQDLPKVWVYGHIHNCNETEILGTKFLRNPLGYPRERNDFKLKTFVL